MCHNSQSAALLSDLGLVMYFSTLPAPSSFGALHLSHSDAPSRLYPNVYFDTPSPTFNIHTMRKIATIYSLLFVLAAGIIAGSLQSCQGSMKHIVGADRDDHGCIASAGYTWSYALHDCVRIWEVGEELSYGQNTISLVFSTDSLFAELFGKDEFHVICRKKKGESLWVARQTGEKVYIRNGVTTAETRNGVFTRTPGK